MKKGNSKKPQQKKPTSNHDYSSLNSELGSAFDLEPPKHYRQEAKPVKPAPKKKQEQKNASDIRKEQKKKRKRSKLFYKVVSILSMVLAIVIVILTLSLTVFFKIDKISVVGNKKYTTAEVVQMLPIETGKNLFMANTENAEKQLIEYLPYIYSAEVKRKLPSTIIVTVKETPKIFVIKNSDDSYTLLDGTLKVLEQTNKKPKKAIIIKDAKIQNAVSGQKVKLSGKKTNSRLLAITKLMNDLKLDEVTAISSKSANSNSIVYDGRITIKLGTIDNLEDKVYSALTAIDKLNESDPNATGTITATNDKQIYFTEE